MHFGILAIAMSTVAPGIDNPMPVDARVRTVSVRSLTIKGKPSLVYADPGNLYIPCFHGENLTIYNRQTRKQTHRILFDAYESVREEEAVPGQTVRKRSVHGCPPGDVVVADGRLFVEQNFSPHVVVFDIPAMRVVRRLPLGGEGRLAAGPYGKTVYFASNKKPEFYVIDTDTYATRAVAYPGTGRGIMSLAVAPDGGRLYLGIQRSDGEFGDVRGGGHCFLAVYDLEKEKYVATVPLAQRNPNGSGDDSIPSSMCFSPDGSHLYVGMFQCQVGVQVVDTKSLQVVHKIDLGGSPVGRPAAYRNWLLYSPSHGDRIILADAATYKELAHIQLPAGKHGINDVLVVGDTLYLCDGMAHAVHILDGEKLARTLIRAQRKGSTLPVRINLKVR